MAGWQTKSSKVVYDNPWMTVYEDQVVMPNGKDGMYGYVESKSHSVYIVPIDADGNTYLVKLERYTLKREMWECAAGRTDGEPVEHAAKRELKEETGLEAQDITLLGDVDVADGMSNFRSSICIATNLKHVSDQLDAEDGIIETKKVPLASIPDMVLAGEITCSQSIAAFYMAASYFEKRKQL